MSAQRAMHKHLVVLISAFCVAATAFAETITVRVTGRDCILCESGIEKISRAQPEVKTVDVDLENKMITITTKPGQTMDYRKITQLLRDTGYSVRAINRAK